MVSPVKARYFLLVSFILLAWMAGSLIFTRPLEESLQKAVIDQLEKPEWNHAFDKVSVRFAGQEAILSGQVTDQAAKDLVESIVAKKIVLRDQNENHNPITCVHNNIIVDNSTLPRPWLIVSSYEGNIRVDGILRDPTQKLELIDAVTAKFPSAIHNNQCVIELKALPCKDWQNTLASLPDFKKLAENQSGNAARFAAASTGNGQWKVFPYDSSNSDIANYLADAGVNLDLVAFALNSLRTTPTTPTTEQPK